MKIDFYWICLIVSVIIASCSQILLKKSANRLYSSKIKEYVNKEVITGYIVMIISTILTILAFTHLDYKNGPIIESLGYVIVMILSMIFLSEKITKKKIIGNCLIILGIYVFYI